jgi:hypothetical protein
MATIVLVLPVPVGGETSTNLYASERRWLELQKITDKKHEKAYLEDPE